MSMQGKLLLKLFCTLLLLHHGIPKTSAISQYKPQQAQAQPKAQQTQQNMQTQPSPMQKQMSMLQHTQVQQQASQTIAQSTANMQEKPTTQEVLMKDANQDLDPLNTYKMINEIKRDNHISPAFSPANPPPAAVSSPPSQPLPASLPLPTSPPLQSSLPFPSWNPNPFMNQGFAAPTPYASQSYPIPNYGFPHFNGVGSPFSATPYQSNPFYGTPKFFPFLGFPQPMFIPYPPFLPPEYFYPPFSGTANEFEDTTSRAANGRRPPLASGRDSPIYYMRLPPTPYMFLPNFGYQPSQNLPPLNYGNNFPPIMPFQISPYSSFGQTLNLPMNFLANGKPTGIHSFLPEIPSPPPFPNFNGFNSRPPLSGNYFQPPYSSPPPPPPPFQDSKLTSLKQPFYFNGRPEDIYVLQNSLNPLFSGL